MAPFTRTAFRMTAFGAEATYATTAATNPTVVMCTATFHRRTSDDADPTQVDESLRSIRYDLLASPATNVTAASVTVTHAQLAALIREASRQAAGL